CFPGEASVALEGGGTKAVRDLQPGERVLALADAGELVYSQVLAFLDHDPGAWKLFYTLHTRAGPRLALTAAHLLFVAEGNCSEGAERPPAPSRSRPGGPVRAGVPGPWPARLSRITRVTLRGARGAFAPLTQQGTLVVDGVAASCYAVVEQHHLAHWAFSPLRLLHRWTGAAGGHGDGLHWYPQLLHRLGGALLDPGRFHPLGVARDAR
uniref:Uncharacterized protein n=1 Tax=Tetraodon nigroviridis TaxID=99883 RepID=H3BXM4_TETNG